MVTVVIVAAGSSARMGGEVDKLFLEVNNLPVVGYTWAAFDSHQMIDEVIVVMREDAEEAFKKLAARLELTKPYLLIRGGDERQDSVRNGVQAASRDCEIIAIHDGARPCVDHDIITDTIEAAKNSGASVAASKIVDTIKISNGNGQISQNIDRTHLWSVQTPQVFKADVILSAIDAVVAHDAEITDDTAACELIGQPVVLVQTKNPNPKVTTDSDLAFIRFLLQQ